MFRCLDEVHVAILSNWSFVEKDVGKTIIKSSCTSPHICVNIAHICVILRCIIIYAFHPNEPHFHCNCIGISIFLYGLSWHNKAHWQRFCDFQDRFAYLLTEMGQAVPTEEDFNKADLVIFCDLFFTSPQQYEDKNLDLNSFFQHLIYFKYLFSINVPIALPWSCEHILLFSNSVWISKF